MKKITLLTCGILALLLTSCYKKDIEELYNQIGLLKSEQIATIDQQISSIQTSIGLMQQTDKDLDSYIKNLQTQAADLEKSISDADKKIDAVKSELLENISTEKSNLLAQIEALRASMQSQLDLINATIEELKLKDSELSARIDELNLYVKNDLKDYIDREDNDNRIWAEVTFSTLEQYKTVTEEIAGIKVQIENLNTSISELDNRLTQQIADEIKKAVEEVTVSTDTKIENTVNDITTAYTSAIITAKDELTKAYKAEIESSITALETSLKSWVAEQLTLYSTIAETDSKLEAMKTSLESQITASQTYLVEMINNLSESLSANIQFNTSHIESLRSELTTLSGTVRDNASKIVSNASAIAANASNISANAQAIKNNSSDIEANSKLIADNSKLIAENKQLIAENSTAIKTLQGNTESANAAKIEENAKLIADNAAAIAANAKLISDNAAAIVNNTTAIVTNTNDIAILKSELSAMETQLTEDYTTAISTAISDLEGKFSDSLQSEIDKVNSKITSDISSVQNVISSLTDRVAVLESDVTNIKQSIATILDEISDLDDIRANISAIMEQIQSIEYIPEYSDSKATFIYISDAFDNVLSSEAILDFEVRPAAMADELAKVWSSALSVKSTNTKIRTKASYAELYDLNVSSASAENGILTVKVNGNGIPAEFFKGLQDVAIRLEISDNQTVVTSDYIFCTNERNIDVNIDFGDATFKRYMVYNFDTNRDNEISIREAEAITEISCPNMLISDLTGIEYCTNLLKMDVSGNVFDYNVIKASQYPLLRELYLKNLDIKDLDLSPAKSLRVIDLTGNSSIQNILLNESWIGFDDRFINTGSGNISIKANDGNQYDYPFTVGQYLPFFGGGVVHQVSDDNSSYKMVSLQEAESMWEILYYPDYATKTGCTDESDGLVNTKILSGNLNSYPAVKYCATYNDNANWYLPSRKELSYLMGKFLAINTYMTTCGGNKLSSDTYYWSSTEVPNRYNSGVEYGNFGGKYDSTSSSYIEYCDTNNYSYTYRALSRDESHKVRCILSF